jgi:hypothetical protein
LGLARSLTIQELESQSMMSPPPFPVKVTPVKSTLELTNASIPGGRPELARELRKEEWGVERDRGRIERMLSDSARAVRDAVKSRVEAGRDMNLHYDHLILLLQHMLWHEGYHHGQMKLALKVAGRPMTDEEAGPITWGVWMNKTDRS